MYNFDDLGKKISEIDERIDALIAKTGLSYSEFAVFYTLAKDGRSTQKKIGQEWLIPKQTVFNVCKDFRQKGLVQPSEQSADKRERAIELTQKGHDAADRIVRASDELGERVFARLGEKKRPEAILATNALLRDLRRRNQRCVRAQDRNLNLPTLNFSFLRSFKFGENCGLNLANIFAGKRGIGEKTHKIHPNRRGKFNINLYGQARNRRLLPKLCDKPRAYQSQKADLAQNTLAKHTAP
jgi:transcriptional regulator, MarR family